MNYINNELKNIQ